MLLLAVQAVFGGAAWAREEGPDQQRFDLRRFTCPLGGLGFEQDVGYASYPLLTMPDGSWLGDHLINAQVPVCPDNGLVLLPDVSKAVAEGLDRMAYHEYTPEELTRLPALIADPQYRTLADDGAYAQAYWLATRLERPAQDRFTMLQRAAWGATDPAVRRRTVERLADDGLGVIAAIEAPDAVRSFYSLYVVNALRELGRFDEALALLDRIEAGGPPPPGQADAEALFALADASEPMRQAIAQRDDGRFAAATLPERVLDDICDGRAAAIYGPIGEPTKVACKLRRDANQKDSDAFEQALQLRDDRPALEARCLATAPGQRGEALDKACDMAQDERDEIAGVALTKDGMKLAADCAATPEDARSRPLRYGCIRLRIATANALGEQLAADPAAYAIMCPGDTDTYRRDRNDVANQGCQNGWWRIKDQLEQDLVADQARLDSYCAAKDRQGYIASRKDIDYEVLVRACSTLEQQRRDAKVAGLATDAAAFDVSCGRYRATNSAGNEVYDLTEMQENCRNAWRLRENRKAQAAAEARGLKCFGDVIYSPERPRCVDPAEYEKQAAYGRKTADTPDRNDMSMYDDGSSLMQAAHALAARMIAAAKVSGTYPGPDEEAHAVLTVSTYPQGE